MRTTGARAIKNFFSLLTAALISDALGFVAVAYLARKLTVEGFGRLSFAQAVLAYFALIADFGLNIFGTREVARDRKNINKSVNNIITLQTSLSLIAAVFMSIFSLSLPRPIEDKLLLCLFAASILLTGLNIDWAFKAVERMEIVAGFKIIKAFVYTSLVLSFVRSQQNILYIPVFLIISVAIGVALLAIVYKINFGWLKPDFDLKFWKHALRIGTPLFFSIVLIQIYYNLDTIMLGFMKTNDVVGLYSAAYKIILVILSLGGLLNETFFPLYSRFYKESLDKLKTLLDNSEKIHMIIAIPLGVGGTLLAEPVISMIYGANYGGAVTPFRILVWTVSVIFIGSPFGFSLMACDRERAYMWGVCCGALANIILNAVLIPFFGMVGAAIATLSAEMAVAVYMIYRSRAICRIEMVSFILKPLISSAVMAIFLILLDIHVLLEVFLGTLVYFVALVLFRGIAKEDVMNFRRYVLGKEEVE